jgi:hypothetical protein
MFKTFFTSFNYCEQIECEVRTFAVDYRNKMMFKIVEISTVYYNIVQE